MFKLKAFWPRFGPMSKENWLGRVEEFEDSKARCTWNSYQFEVSHGL